MQPDAAAKPFTSGTSLQFDHPARRLAWRPSLSSPKCPVRSWVDPLGPSVPIALHSAATRRRVPSRFHRSSYERRRSRIDSGAIVDSEPRIAFDSSDLSASARTNDSTANVDNHRARHAIACQRSRRNPMARRKSRAVSPSSLLRAPP